jgi:hypothetical protein
LAEQRIEWVGAPQYLATRLAAATHSGVEAVTRRRTRRRSLRKMCRRASLPSRALWFDNGLRNLRFPHFKRRHDRKERTMSEDTVQIETAVKTYLDGLHEGDAEKLASVFHPTSRLTYEEGGKLTVLPRDQWLEVVRSRPSPKARGLSRHDEILQIDQASPTMAFVKLRCAIPPRFFTDYLSLLKIDGKWQVAQKVFATETR